MASNKIPCNALLALLVGHVIVCLDKFSFDCNGLSPPLEPSYHPAVVNGWNVVMKE